MQNYLNIVTFFYSIRLYSNKDTWITKISVHLCLIVYFFSYRYPRYYFFRYRLSNDIFSDTDTNRDTALKFFSDTDTAVFVSADTDVYLDPTLVKLHKQSKYVFCNQIYQGLFNLCIRFEENPQCKKDVTGRTRHLLTKFLRWEICPPKILASNIPVEYASIPILMILFQTIFFVIILN